MTRRGSISARYPMASWWARSRSSHSTRRLFSSSRWPWRRIGAAREWVPNCWLNAEAWGSSGGFFLMVLNARMGVEGFYARFGYRAVGEPFDENTVPHIKMTKQLRP